MSFSLLDWNMGGDVTQTWHLHKCSVCERHPQSMADLMSWELQKGAKLCTSCRRVDYRTDNNRATGQTDKKRRGIVDPFASVCGHCGFVDRNPQGWLTCADGKLCPSCRPEPRDCVQCGARDLLGSRAWTKDGRGWHCPNCRPIIL